jgi:EAL domain-containing protein (putative c-di-GMP-specific phosphodiesterase class I)
LHYQPKVNMRSGALVGAEALIRWQHPDQGLLLPGAFLPVIEKHPLSEAVGAWVIDTALAQMSAWQRGGLTLPVSLNIAARQLRQQNFAPQLAGALARHADIDAQNLELELLETSALADIASVSRIMQACHRLGVRFAIDNFGTGCASLNCLRRLPVGTLKIDQSLVRGLLDDADDLAFVSAVIGLASAFHKRVIADGVESLHVGKKLIELGCDLAQGDAIARPMPGDQIPGWSANWEPPADWTRAK